ncbi:hypothetical protein CR513_03602, partial [Mucuna pruriens]
MEDLDGGTTRRSSPKRPKIIVKLCVMSIRCLDISNMSVQTFKRRRRKRISSLRRRKVSYQHGRTLICFLLKKKIKKPTFSSWFIQLLKTKMMKRYPYENFSIGYDKKKDLEKDKSTFDCLNYGIGNTPQSWYLDNCCSQHMMGERSMLQDLRPKFEGWAIFEVNKKGRIASIGKIGKHNFPSINNVLYVEGLKHNLLSISQLCDCGYDVPLIKENNTLHKINLIELTNQNKLGHASKRLILKLNKHHLVGGISKLVFKSNLLCDRC